MTKVYIDISMVMIGTNYTGIPRVVMELAKRLAGKTDGKTDNNASLELIFLEYNQKRDAYEVINTNGFVEFCKTKNGNRNKLRSKKYIEIEKLGLDENNVKYIFFDVDAVWKTRVRRSYLYPILKENGVKIVPFVHDIIGATHPQFCPTDDMICFLDYVGSIVAYADEIVVTSETTKHEIEKQYERLHQTAPKFSITPLGGDFKKVQDDKNITNSNNGNNKNITNKTVLQVLNNNKPYLLMVGTIDPRKNHKLLVDAYDEGLKDLGVDVVIAGYKGWDVDELLSRIENHEDYNKGLYQINGASDDEINALYENCYALAFPSYIEGYGLPIMESLVRGVPVFAADTSINMEIGREYGVYFKQDHPEDLVDKVKMYLEESHKYDEWKKQIKNFVPPTWEACADGVYKVFVE